MWRRSAALTGMAFGALLAGCPEPSTSPACDEWDEVFVWADTDGDGFGDPEAAFGYACEVEHGRATNSVDCDDRVAAVHPTAEEVCDLLDNDCDGVLDEGLPQAPWFPDADRDGFGMDGEPRLFCTFPGDGWQADPGDCDDVDADVNPVAIEVCNGGVDDDCDGAADDGDGSLDTTTTTSFYVDVDGDGFGGDALVVQMCEAPNEAAVTLPGDCDDLDVSISPGAPEVCGPAARLVDEDCDGLIDDGDPSVDPASMLEMNADADGDGYGNPLVAAYACASTPGVAVDNGLDCDDTDPGANVVQEWYADVDGDGAGAGAVVVRQCLRPYGDVAPEAAGLDCEPDDPTISPLAFDPCADGIDQDCSGSDLCASCGQWLDVLGVAAVSGVFGIEPSPGMLHDVWCDMETDGGGWTLVSSSQAAPPTDAAMGWNPDLTTLDPGSTHPGVWTGLRPVVQANADVRFACKQLAGLTNFDVDLSFYDVGWYREITTGLDAESCFNENEGFGADPPPERRNNLTGVTLVAGDAYGAGYLEGEDSCNDTSDFTVDFDDRGMDANMSDGTDWGEDDNQLKCGVLFAGQQWFVFVREP